MHAKVVEHKIVILLFAVCSVFEHVLFPAYMNSVLHFQVLWGESSMIQAERLLLAAALEDPANQRFVLLSDRLVFSNLVVLIQVSIRSCSFYVSVSLLSSSFLSEGRDGWDLAFVCANLLAHGKNTSFYFPCSVVFLCTTFPTCTIISWFHVKFLKGFLDYQ